MKELRIGMLGLGTVARGVASMIRRNGQGIAHRTGIPLRLVRIATRNPGKTWGLNLEGVRVDADVDALTRADDVDVVVELMGGLDPAERLLLSALDHGKHVVTANKALIAERGMNLFETAQKNNRELSFEAAVAGAVPIVKAIRESLAANHIESIHGILNGTCNYILTEMRERGLSFDQTLADAQKKGYAEADPSFDVDGIDTAHKLAILSAIAWGTPPDFRSIHVEGIRRITDSDITWAAEMGYRIKLLAIAKRRDHGLELRVQPTLVTVSSMVSQVEGVFNAVFVKGDYAGTTMYHGRGAGEQPTASAVVADLVDLARNQGAGLASRVPPLSVMPQHLSPLPVHDIADLKCEYYVRLAVVDRPGVLAEITSILANHGISIDAIHQKGRAVSQEAVALVIVTHECLEKEMQASLAAMERLESVRGKPMVIRMESGLT
ncbi:MAG: homoserine dehydrogenase [Magnetococcales bacterium]|nr:homoserine dehydrogenase [Magnetococcales bacterium]MBF0149026.1 homoserine dehydrogenase [Magnetococcales bacterium]MBF0172075.1 homoserine dehydrogenase [Magnetococcales bacterium]MBF0346187.1 homoserine dehydrogenase [Magnetococcales bacterium]